MSIVTAGSKSKMDNITITNFTMNYYKQAMELWEKSEGVGLSSADSSKNISKYLDNNNSTSYIAIADNTVIGTILSGHDYRRGYVYHFVVDKKFRNKGIGTKLFSKSITALKKTGIRKIHIMVYKNNTLARNVWKRLGWKLRNEIDIMSYEL